MISVTSDGVGGAGPLQHGEVAQGGEAGAEHADAEDGPQHRQADGIGRVHGRSIASASGMAMKSEATICMTATTNGG